MELLDLPHEVVDQILSFLVGEVSPLFASHYRLVCKLFAHEIQDQILKRQPLIAYSENERNLGRPADRDIIIAIEKVRFEKLFEQHGGTIIGHKVLRKSCKTSLPVITYLQNLVEAILKSDKELVTDDVRKRYTMEVCTALSTKDSSRLRHVLFTRSYDERERLSLTQDIPSALAATNQISRFLELSQDNYNIVSGSLILPRPLIAASACGHVEMLQHIMRLEDKIANVIYDPPGELLAGNYWGALIASMQKGQKQTGRIFLDYFLGLGGVQYPLPFRWVSPLMEAVKHLDSGFIPEICGFTASMCQRRGQEERMTLTEIQYLLSKGTCSALRFLLENKYMDPDAFGDNMPLKVAMINHRYDLARILLQHGADLNDIQPAVWLLWFEDIQQRQNIEGVAIGFYSASDSSFDMDQIL